MVNESDLRDVADDDLRSEIFAAPSHAFECILSEIQPSLISNPRGLWTEQAVVEFKNIVRDTVLYGKVS